MGQFVYLVIDTIDDILFLLKLFQILVRNVYLAFHSRSEPSLKLGLLILLLPLNGLREISHFLVKLFDQAAPLLSCQIWVQALEELLSALFEGSSMGQRTLSQV